MCSLEFSFLIFKQDSKKKNHLVIYFFNRTMAMTFILSLYLARHDMPVPVWTPSVGFRIIWYPLHKVFAVGKFTYGV